MRVVVFVHCTAEERGHDAFRDVIVMSKRAAAAAAVPEEPEEGESGAGGEGGKAGVGRMVDCSQADDRRMIRLVRARPLLFARNNMPVASYYSRVKALWSEVAHHMGWTVADVRRKWSHIRNSYSRHLRNEMHGARTGKGRMVSRWYLADELEFLREHMATDTRPSPFSTYAPTLLDLEKAEAPADPDVKPFLPGRWFSLPSGDPLASGPFAFDSKPEPCSNDESSSSAFEPDENSSYFQFFRGIYNEYQELPPRKQRLFKRKCMDFLHELLDEDEGPVSLVCQDAINLTGYSRSESDEERDQKICVLQKVEQL